MARQVINNDAGGETGLTARTKINDMTQELYDAVAGTPVADLDAADPLEGDEILPVVQDGVAVQTNVEDLSGGPVAATYGHSRNRQRRVCTFQGTTAAFSSSTTGAYFGVDPAQIYCSGTGAQVAQASWILLRWGMAVCSTGTTSSGYAGITATGNPLITAAATSVFDVRIIAGLSAAPTGAQDFDAQIGLFTPSTGAATDGLYFFADSSNANWQAISNNGGTKTTTDTGVAVDTSYKCFRVDYDKDTGDALYYIDGSLVATITTNFPENVLNEIGGLIIKTAGTTSRDLKVDAWSIDVTANAGLELVQYL